MVAERDARIAELEEQLTRASTFVEELRAQTGHKMLSEENHRLRAELAALKSRAEAVPAAMTGEELAAKHGVAPHGQPVFYPRREPQPAEQTSGEEPTTAAQPLTAGIGGVADDWYMCEHGLTYEKRTAEDLRRIRSLEKLLESVSRTADPDAQPLTREEADRLVDGIFERADFGSASQMRSEILATLFSVSRTADHDADPHVVDVLKRGCRWNVYLNGEQVDEGKDEEEATTRAGCIAEALRKKGQVHVNDALELVRAEEREECLRICDDTIENYNLRGDIASSARRVAAAIRERSAKEGT